MQTKSSIAYKSFANFFMSLGLYSLTLIAIGIKQGISTNIFLVFVMVLFLGLLNKINYKVQPFYGFLARLTFMQKEIFYYSIAFAFIRIIGEESINGYANWIAMMIEQNKYITVLGYEAFTKYILAFFIPFCIYLAIKTRINLLFLLIYVFFILSWHFYVKSSYGLSVIYSIGVLAYFIDKATFNSDIPTKESKINIYGPIVGLVIAIIAFMIPIKLPVIYIDDYADEMIRNIPILGSMRDAVQDKIQGSSFRLSQMPFQPDNKVLGGSVKLSKNISLKVKSAKPLYLRGSIKNEYTGYSWKNTEDIYYKMYDNKLEINPINLGYDPKEITIYPERLKTRTIFNPYFTYEVNLIDKELIYTQDLEIMINKGQKNQTQPYTVSYFDVDFIRERAYTDEENERLKQYTTLPYTVTQRTKSLAREITKDKEGSYFKLLAIEDYLKNNYPYTLQTSDLPEDTDFVDYFLFEEKEGYCTYFASAMAVMARSIEIPTRYVEGFRMSEEKENENLYIVREDKAHAWVEAYIPGTGWLSFEPTGSLTQAQIDTRKKQELLENNNASQGDIVKPNQSTKEPSMNEQIDAGFEYDDSEVVTNEANESKTNYLIYSLIAFLGVIALSYKKILQKIKIYGIIRSKGKIGFMKHYQGIIDIVNMKESQINDLTPKETMSYINKKYNLVEEDLGEVVNEVLYSGCELTDEQMNIMQNAYKSLLHLRIGL